MFKDGSMKKFLKGVDKINHLGFMFRIRLCELRTMKKRFPPELASCLRADIRNQCITDTKTTVILRFGRKVIQSREMKKIYKSCICSSRGEFKRSSAGKYKHRFSIICSVLKKH